MEEVWKDIQGYEGYYQVSSLGRVKSLERTIRTKTGHDHFVSEKILRQCLDADGYPIFQLCKNNKTTTSKTHRHVALAFIPNPEDKATVNHIDGDPTNNRVDNLEWNTMEENMIHSNNILQSRNGEKSHFAKLTEKQVLEIRSKYVPRQYSMYVLAREYNVVPATICLIVKRANWKHI